MYPHTFHKKLFVQRADELFDREFEGGIGCHGWVCRHLEARDLPRALCSVRVID